MTPFFACLSKNDIAIVLNVSWKKQCKRTAIFQMLGCWNNAEVPIQIVGGHGANTVRSTRPVVSNMVFSCFTPSQGERMAQLIVYIYIYIHISHQRLFLFCVSSGSEDFIPLTANTSSDIQEIISSYVAENG